MGMFLLLSLLSGILEIGVVLYGFAVGMPAWAVLAMAAMYQFGNLVCVPGKIRPFWIGGLGIFNLCLSIANLFWKQPVVMAVLAALSSFGIQTARAGQKAACPTWLKRLFRIGGFLLAPLMTVCPALVMVFCAGLPLAALLCGYKTGAFIGKTGKIGNENAGKALSAVMVFHQMHYFVYTYGMLLYLLGLTGNPKLCVVWFAWTWVVYLLPGWIAERRKRYRPRILFFVCHTFLAVLMVILTEAVRTAQIRPGFWAWMLTGLGGGSVFCIRRLTKREETCNMTLSENIGHFTGTLVSVGVSFAAGGTAMPVLTALSGIFVGMALVTAAFGIAGEERRKRENGRYGQGRMPS